MQYLACKFDRGGRPYTYHNDGAPVTVGDRVKLPARDGDGWQPGTVTAIVDRPSFATKGIRGKVPAEPAAQPDLLERGA